MSPLPREAAAPSLEQSAEVRKTAIARDNFAKAAAWDKPWRRATLWKARVWPEIFGLEYLHKGEMITDDAILLREILESGPFHYLKGATHPGGRGRNIQLDRVHRAWNVLSGQPIPDPGTYFATTLPSARSSNPAHEAVMTRARSGLTVLTWIAGTSRPLTDDERGVLLDFISARQATGRHKTAGGALDIARAAKEIDLLASSRAAALAVAERLAAKGAEAVLLKDFAARLVALGGDDAARRAREVLAPLADG